MRDMLIRLLLFLLRGGAEGMIFVTVYVSLIVAGRRKIEEVPANIREDVRADLEALGYDFGN